MAWDFYDPYGLQVHKHPFGSSGPVFTYPNVPRYIGILDGEPLNQRVARRTDLPRSTRLDDLNLLVNMPSGAWTKLDPKQTGSHARYLISRNDPTIVISLAGDRAGSEASTTNASLLAESQAKMKSLPGGAIQPGERPVTVAGIEGLAYEATVGEGDAKTCYSIWVAAHHGYTYKLAVYGPETDKPAIHTALLNFTRTIKQIQPTRVAHGNTNKKTVAR